MAITKMIISAGQARGWRWLAKIGIASHRLRSRHASHYGSQEPATPHSGSCSVARNPRGQLDDELALEYARRLGFRGEVLDVAGNTGADSPQVKMALERVRRDETVTAIYGFSGGGYNARLIWKELTATERERIRKLIVIGSPE